jgi:hypothetical protein
MRNRVITILLLLGSLSVAATAHAQTTTYKAQVPFPFVVGNQTLPAGTYQVQRLLGRPVNADQVGLIVIRSTDSLVYKAVLTNVVRQPFDANRGSQLVFANLGGQHYLSEVHVQGEKDHQIPNSSRQFERAGSDASQEEVVVAELH